MKERLLSKVGLPVNLHGNDRHPFCATPKLLRREATARARALPVLAHTAASDG